MSFREFVWVTIALTFGGWIAAACLAASLIVLANVDAHLPLSNDIAVDRIFWMSVAFCLFTMPIAWFVGAPLYYLLRRYNLLRVWVCAVLGFVVGNLGFYGLAILPGVHGSMEWHTVLWLGLSGAGAGTILGLLLRPARKRA